MSSSIFDAMETVWTTHEDPIDWDAMLDGAENIDDTTDREAALDGIETLRKDWHSTDHEHDVMTFEIGGVTIMQGYDRGWATGTLDEHGLMVIGGFYSSE